MRVTKLLPLAFILAAPALLSTLSGCIGCTDVGCDDGLIVRFSSPIPPGSTVTATSPFDGERSIECTGTTSCEGVFFERFTPTQVSIVAELPEGSETLNVSPTYRDFQPNGEDCEPTCRIAEVSFEL